MTATSTHLEGRNGYLTVRTQLHQNVFDILLTAQERHGVVLNMWTVLDAIDRGYFDKYNMPGALPRWRPMLESSTMCESGNEGCGRQIVSTARA